MFKHTMKNFPLITEKEQIYLSNLSICFFGINSISSWAIEFLVRSGIGKIYIIDNTEYHLESINRYNYANFKTLNVKKSSVLVEEMKIINPDLYITICSEKEFADHTNAFFSMIDIIIDCGEYNDIYKKINLHEKAVVRGIPVYVPFLFGYEFVLIIFDTNSMSLRNFLGDIKQKGAIYEKLLPIFPEYLTKKIAGNTIMKIINGDYPEPVLCSCVTMGASVLTNTIIKNTLNVHIYDTAPNCLVYDLFENKIQMINPHTDGNWIIKDKIKELGFMNNEFY